MIDFFEKQSDREEILYLLVYSPMTTTTGAGPGLNQEPETLFESPHECRGLGTWTFSTALPGVQVGSWVGSGATVT